ncbi:hydroxylysine kinase-like [Contarinia nasturtii]|uniref:hydroxylysine kinase-like n=1 Tax=Contarinia nasturtii TaxID=265458 RepID=UPI0012D421B9|nr:hydroxylysine kinase-like [Contarinia nasturtii]
MIFFRNLLVVALIASVIMTLLVEAANDKNRARRLKKLEDRKKSKADSKGISTSANSKPESKIRPLVSKEEAICLAKRLYGISTRNISELVSYDDKNFLIHVDTIIKNPAMVWPHGYVLKIINSLDTKKPAYFDGQTQLILFLRQQGIECPKPVKNIFGKYNSIEKIGGSSHLVRLLEYIPGQMFDNVLKTKHLFYQVGHFVAKIDSALKPFQHDGFKNHTFLWMLDSVPQLSKLLYAINDIKKQALIQEVLKEFDEKVLAHSANFSKGIIHGDFNENNIVVTKTSSESNEFRVTGVIDFGDACYSFYIFELAITIAYMILQTSKLETAGYVIAGYQELRPIPNNERDVLKICVAARLCQSLVLGAYTHTLNPENDYLLTTQENGWKVLSMIWDKPKKELDELWFTTADEYFGAK